MNKDLDERLVPNGEYRDAMNIQVSTTDGDANNLGNAGTVQNLKGNSSVGTLGTVSFGGVANKIIGSVSDDATNSAYFFSAAPIPLVGFINSWPEGIVNIPVGDITTETIWVDSIARVSNSDAPVEPILVDMFAVTNIKSGVVSCDTNGDINNGSVYKSNGSFESTPTNGYDQLQVLDGTKYRVGMRIYAQTSAGVNLLSDGDDEFVEIIKISANVLTLAKQQTTDLNTATVFKFVYPERVLEFDYYKEGFEGGMNTISSINILDDLLMWTDGKHEPKKINIKRCERGTTSFTSHTQLLVNNPSIGDLVPVSEIEYLDLNWLSSDIKKENITTIKIAPTSPPTITIKDSDRTTVTSFPITGYTFIGNDNNVPQAGDSKFINFPSSVDFRLDDIYTFTASNTAEPIAMRGKIIEIDADDPSLITIELIFVDSDLTTAQNPSTWTVELEKRNPLFETKFGRFAYRYKYEDNEYSTFSPWSELAFLPGDFLYSPTKGFNEGMANNVRQLIINNFIPNNYERPNDVKAVDILWKTTDNTNVYIVKTITREIDNEWKDFVDSEISNTGSLTITSEMIYKVVEANQLLRAWDNVPRYAKAQEITGNRLVYGNYMQGYDLKSNIGLEQTIVSEKVGFPNAKKSIKSLRTYQFGVVVGDKYGRETPVISSGYKASDGQVLGTSKVSKSLASLSNKFKLKPVWENSSPMEMKWIDYLKYYVKETSNEYYNLILDRWFDAGDDAIWLSFNSADRNKVDEETYLILKNEHGGQSAVEEKARYKILAIENEAPDYIKTDNREFNLVEINSTNIYGDNWPNDADGAAITDAVPSALINNRTIRSNAFPIDENGNIKGLEFKGTPKVRIVAKFTDSGGNKLEARSPLRTVTRVISGTDNELPGIAIRESYSLGDVNMYQKIITQLNDVSELPIATADAVDSGLKYYIQLVDAVVENKSFFDGKFFVKIAKDSALQERILGNALGEYEVLNTYEIAYIANQQVNPAQVSEYASTQPYESSNWDDYTSADDELLGFSNSSIGGVTAEGDTNLNIFPNYELGLPAFGNLLEGSQNQTDIFWTQWYTSASRTADIFIDEATAFSGFNLQSSTNQDALTNFNCGYEPVNTVNGVTNWQPKGLSNGTYSGGWKGQLMFSMIGGDNNPMWQGTNSYFKAKMQTPGTLFRFRDDPNQEIYRVFQSTQSIDNGGVVDGPVTITGIRNFDNDGTSDYVQRETIIVRFERLDNNGVGTGAGLDAAVWDPRAEVQHNGLGSLTIDFVQRTQVQNLSDDEVSSNSACFETEPKEDVGLDIYYEASGAVPVRLNQKNIKTFTGSNKTKEKASLFFVNDREINNNIFEQINLTGSPYVYDSIGKNNVHIKRDVDGTDTDLATINTITTVGDPYTDENGDLVYAQTTTTVSDGICAAIDDIVSFKNKNGLVTKSKIIDHVKVLNASTSPITVPSDRTTLSNGVSANLPLNDDGILYGTIAPPSNPVSSAMIGREVTGTGIDKGTFITEVLYDGMLIKLNKKVITSETADFTLIDVTGIFEINKEVWEYPVELGWFNCYSFGNGVESDRIRDDFNTPQIDNGVKASSTFLEYGEEKKSSSMIYSGLYNSTSGVNNLNQFNQAEKITKDLNTTYGSIQAMKTRDGDVVVFAEDKVLKVMSSGKDAVFNADNNPQLTVTDRVLGHASPFAGNYGISKNPESLAVDQYRMYFTDKQRGAVLRLSRDGLTPISDVGMKDYFRVNLKKCTNLIGSFDGVSDEYNITLKPSSKWDCSVIGNVTDCLNATTISFSESNKGWVSFKSFVPLTAISVNDKYYSTYRNKVYEHHKVFDNTGATVDRNTFYGVFTESSLDVIFNESPGSVKSFITANYEGSQARINQFTTQSVEDAVGNTITANDGEYYNIGENKTGWYADSINTDLQSGNIPEFIEKENKWFNYIRGEDLVFNNINTSNNNLDVSEFSVQGVGFPGFLPVNAGSLTTYEQVQQNAVVQGVDSNNNPL